MEVVSSHRTAMKRQTSEWLLIIEGGKKQPTLNSKNDWNAEKLPRITINNEDEEITKKNK